jgi:hypothetical protein
MRKVKLLIAVLVCSVMMMGVGYAWWQDSITVATTANTGDLNMEFAWMEVVFLSKAGILPAILNLALLLLLLDCY